LAKSKKDSARFTALAGTPIYMAPELFYSDKNTISVDIYSMGIIIYEMFAARPPFAFGSLPLVTLAMKIMSGEMKLTFDYNTPNSHPMPADLQPILLDCCNPEPSLRPTALQLLQRLKAAKW